MAKEDSSAIDRKDRRVYKEPRSTHRLGVSVLARLGRSDLDNLARETLCGRERRWEGKGKKNEQE